MNIMQHIYSGIAALRSQLEGNDAALLQRAAGALGQLSPDVHALEFPEDHSHEAVAASVAATVAQAAVLSDQLNRHLGAIEAAPRGAPVSIAPAAPEEAPSASQSEAPEEDAPQAAEASDGSASTDGEAHDGGAAPADEANGEGPLALDEAEPVQEKGPEPTAQTL